MSSSAVTRPSFWRHKARTCVGEHGMKVQAIRIQESTSIFTEELRFTSFVGCVKQHEALK
jgi:hypothetical protein